MDGTLGGPVAFPKKIAKTLKNIQIKMLRIHQNHIWVIWVWSYINKNIRYKKIISYFQFRCEYSSLIPLWKSKETIFHNWLFLHFIEEYSPMYSTCKISVFMKRNEKLVSKIIPTFTLPNDAWILQNNIYSTSISEFHHYIDIIFSAI